MCVPRISFSETTGSSVGVSSLRPPRPSCWRCPGSVRRVCDVIDVGVERSLEIVMAPEEGVDEEPGSDADWFLAGSARLEERPDLLERLAERASTIGDLAFNLASWASEDLPHDLLPTRLANRGIRRRGVSSSQSLWRPCSLSPTSGAGQLARSWVHRWRCSKGRRRPRYPASS